MKRTCLCILMGVGVLALGVAALEAADMACSCTGTACGNNAIGGDRGDIFTKVSEAEAAAYFTTNPKTGWTCVVPAKVRGTGGPEGCYCRNYCGNGGIGADPKFFDLGLSEQRIDQYYGGGESGNRTGWLCGNYRGDFTAPANMACVCTGSACGNDAIGGDQGDIFDQLTVDVVNAKFKTNPDTGWTCLVPAKVRGKDGPKGCYCEGYCGNGGIGADPHFIDLGLAQQDVDKLYGGGKPGNRTGWLCGNYRGSL